MHENPFHYQEDMHSCQYSFKQQKEMVNDEDSVHDIQVDSHLVCPHGLDGYIQQISNDQEKE